MQKISTFEIQNYKNLRDIYLEPKDLNIFIGPNGSGKSNLIQTLALLRAAANGRLSNALTASSGIKNLLSRKTEGPIIIHLTLTGMRERRMGKKLGTGQTAEREKIYYKVELSPKGDTFTVTWEQLSQEPSEPHTSDLIFFRNREGQLEILRSKPQNNTEGIRNNLEVFKSHELLISQLRDPNAYPLITEIQEMFSEWIIFRGLGDNALDKIHSSQLLNVVKPLFLEADGSNFHSVLYVLRTEHRAAYQTLRDWLEMGFPSFEDLDLRLVGSGEVSLYWRTKDDQFPSKLLSDGQLRYLGLATLCCLPEVPSLIAIDEPEVGLHPKLLPLVASMLKDLSHRTQVIVTTHSPHLLQEPIELEDVILVNLEGQKWSQMRRADSRADLHEWIKSYDLGRLWDMGYLEEEF
jgi:predicted ATPase